MALHNTAKVSMPNGPTPHHAAVCGGMGSIDPDGKDRAPGRACGSPQLQRRRWPVPRALQVRSPARAGSRPPPRLPPRRHRSASRDALCICFRPSRPATHRGLTGPPPLRPRPRHRPMPHSAGARGHWNRPCRRSATAHASIIDREVHHGEDARGGRHADMLRMQALAVDGGIGLVLAVGVGEGEVAPVSLERHLIPEQDCVLPAMQLVNGHRSFPCPSLSGRRRRQRTEGAVQCYRSVS